MWDLIGTPFGARSTLYERYFSGDLVRHRQNRFRTYDSTKATKSYRDFLAHLPGAKTRHDHHEAPSTAANAAVDDEDE